MCDECDWQDYLERADDMINEERFDFAADTICGIREWVADNQHITERQKDALDNIADAVERFR